MASHELSPMDNLSAQGWLVAAQAAYCPSVVSETSWPM